MSDSWPTGVPESLWNYGRLQIQDVPQVPMMGVQFSDQFKVAFVAGFLFVGYVAWKRFNTVQSEADGFRYRVMREVGVAELGGASALRRAYCIYLATMLALYVAFTFFGKLIVQTVNSLNVVGIQVDSSSLKFDSPQWPLLLAFGFAGLAPLIPQLRGAENWLFRRAYRAVGIPVRIDQTTRNLLDLLAGGKSGAVAEMAAEVERRSDALEAKLKGTWAHEMLSGRESKLRNAVTVLAELDLLVDLAKGGRGAWPGSEVSNSLRELELKLAESAEDLLDEFDSRLGEATGRKTRASAAQAAKGGAAGDSAADQRAKYLVRTLQQAGDLREELVAVLAVYVERDPDYVETLTDGTIRVKVRHDGLRKLLEQADPPNLAGSGPEFGVLIFIGLCVPVYTLFAWQGLHPLLSPRASSSNLQVVLATTLVETLRLLSIFWFPLLAAFGLRQFYSDEGVWVDDPVRNPSAYAEQRLAALTLGFALAVLCLVGLAALWAFFIAKDVTAFRNNLIAGNPSFLLFYPTMAVISLPVIWHSLAGADARARIPTLTDDGARLKRTGLVLRGVVCGLLVAAIQIGHLAYWYRGYACTTDGVFLVDIYYKGCFQYYGALDFITMPLLAFLCVVMFGKPHASGSIVNHAPKAPVPTPPAAGAVPLASGIALLVLVLASTAGIAQEAPVPTVGTEAGSASTEKPKTDDVVRIGFRADAEPFSYRSGQEANADHSKPLYKGFLADLCYWIFDGSRFEVRETQVKATTRFEDLSAGRIDVLCDPVTMRFSDEDRTMAGTYSPIVFATAISYLRRPARSPRPTIYVGYVAPSTATRVAEHACRIDLFNIVDEDQRPQIAEMCDSATVVRDLEKLMGPEKLGSEAVLSASVQVHAARAAAAEKMWAEDRARSAGATTKAGYDAAVKRWTDAVEYLAQCSPGCSASRVARSFGELCGGPEADRPRDEWQPTLYRFCPRPDHASLIEWFCRDGRSPRKVYLGDREIILGKLRTWNEHEPIRCGVESETAAANLTYEPYALMSARIQKDDTPAQAMRREEITRLVQRRVYEFFSFGSLARAKFDTYFVGPNPGWTMSTPLAYLFVLNGVEEEWMFTFPPPPPEAGN